VAAVSATNATRRSRQPAARHRGAAINPESSVMPDERQESTRQGIAPPPESEIGRAADERRRREVINTPPEAQPDSAMGGTSDADSPGDEAWTPKP
jgi:hypothetical protein